MGYIYTTETGERHRSVFPFFLELVVKYLPAYLGYVCACTLHSAKNRVVTKKKLPRKGPVTARKRYSRQNSPRSWCTHQSQVLHCLRKHALMQLQFADFHYLHTSDGVASWEKNPGRNQKANSISSSHLHSQHFIRRLKVGANTGCEC